MLIFIDYKNDIDFYKRQVDDKEETNKKLKITIHDLTVSYEGQKNENSNLKSIKCNLESEKETLSKENNDQKRQLVALKAH